ncbi:hypothetical protein OPV22_030978 [Ensete ventricosum]|uniref:Uncharacterized protein n=1 Tax=Ensete ventricosum TaxID=4639 RepID=A0AAV8PS92_ENSVE|nr:hypothetical protein OPV22_030978 [Ensete ventricosum]
MSTLFYQERSRYRCNLKVKFSAAYNPTVPDGGTILLSRTSDIQFDRKKERGDQKEKEAHDSPILMGVDESAAEHRGVIHAYLELYRSSLGYRAPVGGDAPLPVHRSDGAAVDGFDAAEAVAPHGTALVAHRNLGLRFPFLCRMAMSDAPPHVCSQACIEVSVRVTRDTRYGVLEKPPCYLPL